jgi:putative PIN family toxin of toxin-antitoxin system
MPSAVLDSVVLVSALLTPGGVANAVVRHAREGAFLCCLSDAILDETRRVLLDTPRLRQRFVYTDADAQAFLANLRAAAYLVEAVPAIEGVVRDPNDDMVIACAVAAAADYVVSRDDDLLALGSYEGIAMITPEAFMDVLRRRSE